MEIGIERVDRFMALPSAANLWRWSRPHLSPENV